MFGVATSPPKQDNCAKPVSSSIQTSMFGRCWCGAGAGSALAAGDGINGGGGAATAWDAVIDA